MNKNPVFSIVIPAYNRANIIYRAIDSVLTQTYNNYEIIVVDDGSTDNLKDICNGYNSEKIKYVYQEKNGSNPARNNGIKHSKGTYVSFLDSDDEWRNNYLAEIYKKFQMDNDIGFVYTKYIRIHLPKRKKKIKKLKNIEGYIYKKVLKQGYLINSSCITVKRSVLENICINGDYWDNNLFACQDDDICIRLSKITKIGFINEILCTTYIDDRIDRISSSKSRRAYNTFSLWEKHKEDIIQYCGIKNFEKKIFKVYISFLNINDKQGQYKCKNILSVYSKIPDYKYNIIKIKYLYFKIIKNIRLFLKI